MNKTHAQTIFPWLKANLGPRALAPLTHTDADALKAAVEIVNLWSGCREDEVAKAFGLVVGQMQPHSQQFAFHAIAHVMDWSTRAELWQLAGLDMAIKVSVCKFGPQPPSAELEEAAA